MTSAIFEKDELIIKLLISKLLTLTNVCKCGPHASKNQFFPLFQARKFATDLAWARTEARVSVRLGPFLDKMKYKID